MGPIYYKLIELPEGRFLHFRVTPCGVNQLPHAIAIDIFFCVSLFLSPKDVASWQCSGRAFKVRTHGASD